MVVYEAWFEHTKGHSLKGLNTQTHTHTHTHTRGFVSKIHYNSKFAYVTLLKYFL